MLQITPPQPDGRNVGGLTRRMRRVGRPLLKRHRNFTWRRIFTRRPVSCFIFSSRFEISRRDAETQRESILRGLSVRIFSHKEKSSSFKFEKGLLTIPFSNSNSELQLTTLQLFKPKGQKQ